MNTQGNAAHHNPLDRNHDGKVNLQDLKSNTTGQNHQSGFNNQTGLNHNVLAPGQTSTTTTTTTQAGLVGPNAGHVNNVGVTGAGHHNPLDRNHDGKVNLQDLTGHNNQTGFNNQTGYTSTNQTVGAGQGPYVQSNRRASVSRADPTIVEVIQKDVVVHEHIHPVQKEEIQPIIYREREQLDVKQVTQLLHETQIQPTIVQQRELPAERRDVVVEKGAPIVENYHASSREVDSTLRSQVVHAPIVNEVIKKTVIEEIQPVLERDIITSTVIQNTQPIYEKYVEAPQVYRETVTVVDRGVVGGSLDALIAQGFNLGTVGQRLSQTYTQDQILASQQGFAHQGVTGQQGYALGQGVTGQSVYNANQPGYNATNVNQANYNAGLTGAGHHNPLDRNHDGKVNFQDLKSNTTGQNNTGFNNTSGVNNTSGLQGVAAHHNPLDKNHDGKVNFQDLKSNTTGQHNTGFNNTSGLQGVAAHHNPLDKNHDGKVNLQDLTGRQTGQPTNHSINSL